MRHAYTLRLLKNGTPLKTIGDILSQSERAHRKGRAVMKGTSSFTPGVFVSPGELFRPVSGWGAILHRSTLVGSAVGDPVQELSEEIRPEFGRPSKPASRATCLTAVVEQPFRLHTSEDAALTGRMTAPNSR